MSGSIIYFAICDGQFNKKLAFSYLAEIQKEFSNSHGDEALRPETRPYQFLQFENFMLRTKKIYTDSKAFSNIDQLNNDLIDVKNVMNQNIQDLLYRGESLDKMSDVSQLLKSESLKYRKAAKKINFDALLRQYAPVAMLGLFFVFLIWWIFLR